MTLMRKLIVVLFMLCAMQVQAEVMAGRDYKELKPAQPISSGSKVEVLEFFFYGCSHCFHLHGPLSNWEKTMPKDVDLQYVPVIFRDSWEPMARTFYALEAMGEREHLHNDLFEAWNVFGTDLSDQAKISEFVAKRGVDRSKFDAAYNSFTLAGKVARSNQLVRSYGVRGTPTIAVDGKYIITGLEPAETIRVLNEVIKIARKERSKQR
ncbi:MAG: thiol:disulfide interchange protein DsbA/DsbL [Gammaproteobacteria bacterium]|nr:thiol:disulfide interchange protein DsbA/DsbL [Gammaproteobacteria bacterium]MBU1624689.1 thiol:disulfide interchange protein DsbA/DsbL [Gammaproteobacteria bacterium]MBU1982533.1 thiol:disulfide interchange protein DsbA/DsbL [Gammaproteobacteria bacterium]